MCMNVCEFSAFSKKLEGASRARIRQEAGQREENKIKTYPLVTQVKGS